jgi:hypothetical protein
MCTTIIGAGISMYIIMITITIVLLRALFVLPLVLVFVLLYAYGVTYPTAPDPACTSCVLTGLELYLLYRHVRTLPDCSLLDRTTYAVLMYDVQQVYASKLVDVSVRDDS